MHAHGLFLYKATFHKHTCSKGYFYKLGHDAFDSILSFALICFSSDVRFANFAVLNKISEIIGLTYTHQHNQPQQTGSVTLLPLQHSSSLPSSF